MTNSFILWKILNEFITIKFCTKTRIIKKNKERTIFMTRPVKIMQKNVKNKEEEWMRIQQK